MILGNVLKAVVFRLTRPPRGVEELRVGRVRASFLAGDYGRLRYLRHFGDREGVNEAAILELLMDALSPGDVVYDVGANIGIHTVFLAKRVGPAGRVVAFEPDPEIADILDAHIRLNGLANVTVVRAALGARESRGELFYDRKIGRGSTGLVRREGRSRSGAARIARGDEIVAELGLPAPRAVKIDVEGYEAEVVAGLERTLRSPGCAVLFCEIHPALLPDGRTQDDVLRSIERAGFSLVSQAPRGHEVHAMFRKAGA